MRDRGRVMGRSRVMGRGLIRRGPRGRTHEGIGFPLFDDQSPLGAFPQTGPQAVAELIGQQLGLAVHDLDGPFRTGGDTEAAAVAFFLVDTDYGASFHGLVSFS
jgi:hypothetical protein